MLRHPTVGLCVVCLLIASLVVVGALAAPARATTYPSPAYHVDGTVANEFSANSIALLDLNRDGVADLAVGAPFNATSGKPNAGSVTFFLSERVGSAILPFQRAITVFGSAAGDLFGWSLANVGNLDGSGPALAVGSPHASPNGHHHAGNITLFSPSAAFAGRARAWINSTSDGEGLGYSLAGAGDINGDGFDDLIAGAPFCGTGATEGGCAYVFYGAASGPHVAPDLTFDSSVAGAHFGWSVAGNGSVDGSSALSIVVGAPNYTSGGQASRGAAYVIRNPAGTVRTSLVLGANAGDEFGFSVALGDFNGDTVDDIAIGAPYNGHAYAEAGEVSVIYGGSPFKPTIDLLLDGHGANEWFGYALASGNFHKDNLGDLLVGAPGSRVNATGIGRAYGFYGSPLPWTTANVTLVPGVSEATAFGASVAVGGNFTPSGGPGYLVGDPQFQRPAGPNVGRAYAYPGDIVPTQNNPIVLGWVCVPNTYRGGANPCSGLSGFSVTLTSSRLSRTDTSRANGSFGFAPIPGTYWLNTTAFPYVANSTTVTLSFNQVLRVFFYPTTIPIVRGTAADAVNRTPYPGVTVALYNATNVLVNSTVTSGGGTYSMFVPSRFVPASGTAATLTVRMWDAAHYTNSSSVSVRRNVTSTANMFLNRFPVVSGTVFDQRTLAPIPGAIVQATQGAIVTATVTTNGRGVYTLVATNASVPHVLYLNVTSPGYGRVQASLAVNRNETYSPVDVYLLSDHIAPTSNVWPLLPRYTKTATFSLGANASDNNGVQQVQLWYRFNNTGSYVKYAVDTAAPYTFSFNATAARGDGRYEFYTIAVDYAGNVESAPSTNDTWTWVDTVTPSLSVTYPTPGLVVLKSWVNVTWIAKDAGSGLRSVDVQLDQNPWVHRAGFSFLNLTTVADGSHNVTVNATDRAGNGRTVTVAFSVNTASPVVTFTSPANGTLTRNSSVTLSWTISNPGAGITSLQVAADTGSWQTLATTATSYRFTGLTDGGHSLWVKAVTSNAQTAVYLRVIVDATPPTISITAPTGNPWVKTTSETIAFSASDATSGIATVWLSLDNGSAVNVTGQTSSTVGSLTDGPHRVVLTAIDRAGNTASAAVTFRVDATLPTISITSPTGNPWVNKTSETIAFSASDATSGIATVWLSLDNGSAVNVTGQTSSTVGSLTDGPHRVVLTAIDRAGNTASAAVTFRADATLPTVTFAAPANGATLSSSTVAVQWLASDAGSGVSSAQISLDGSAFETVTPGGTKTFVGLADGQHTVVVRATDAAGNVRVASVTFSVSTQLLGSNVLAYGLIGAVVVVVLVIVLVAWRMRKPKAPEVQKGAEVPKEPEAPKEEEKKP